MQGASNGMGRNAVTVLTAVGVRSLTSALAGRAYDLGHGGVPKLQWRRDMVPAVRRHVVEHRAPQRR
jgi:hypothetical protein